MNVPPDIPARARIAVAWAEWAAGTDVPEFAAEAYGKLVALSAQDAAARRGASARERVLAASQEYAEEAGYWLARAGKYREAALALETGRAIGLTGSPDKVRYADITSQTGDGALVYLAAARAGGYALVVAATHDPQYVDLPRLDRATVAGITGRLIGRAAGNVAAGPTPPADRLPQGLTTRMTGPAPAAGQLPTTGRTGAAPAAERLVRDLGMAANDTGVADPVDGALRALWEGGVRDLLMHARGRVVTLVPLGLLNLLPLHAAGGTGHDDEWRHAGIFSAIRYAPNARALGRCRDNARHLTGAEHTLLTIDVPDSPGQPNLPYVAREALEVARRWTGGGVRSIRSCTWDEFRAAAGSATVWHLACHGSAEPGNILESRLCFADRAVTLAELTGALRPGPRRLAVLSACQTNVVGSALPNEVVGLPSALVQLGFAGVIATAWPVDDLATAFLMTRFYEFWRHDGNDPPTALNQAQEWLRTATPSDLLAALPGVHPPAGPEERPYAAARFWAAFACTGA